MLSCSLVLGLVVGCCVSCDFVHLSVFLDDDLSPHILPHEHNVNEQEELKEWDQCLLMLGDAKVDEHGNVNITKDCSVMYLDKDGEDREINVIFFLYATCKRLQFFIPSIPSLSFPC